MTWSSRPGVERQRVRARRPAARLCRYLENGIDVYEYRRHFTHLKMAVFDERWSIHGSTNLNYRSLEDDKDFELVVLRRRRTPARRTCSRACAMRTFRARSNHYAGESRGLARGSSHQDADPRTLLLIPRRML